MGKTKIKMIDDSIIEEPKERKTVKSKNIAAGGAEERSQASTAVPILHRDEDAPEKPKRQDPQLEELEKQGQTSEKNDTKKPVSKIKSQTNTTKKKVRSKKYQAILENFEKNQKLPVLEAVKTAQANSYSKFEGTIEAHINTNAKNLRGLVNMPFAKGKKLRILAFGLKESDSEDIIVGNDQIISQIEAGKINFDIVVTTPEWMMKLAKVARILGPRGLMPNPKNGTISDPSVAGLEKTIVELQGGKTEYKTESSGQVIHLSVGKVSQKPEEIAANLKVIYNTIGRSKIQRISLAPTMGPSIKVELTSLS